MAKPIVHLALFKEDQLDEASEAIHRLRELGLKDEDISVISGAPISEKMLGRPMSWTRIPLIAICGAAAGFLVALFLNWGTPALYPVHVGGMGVFTLPTSFIPFFELTMLGLLISTFLGVVVEMISPTFGPKGYDPRISEGQIGVLFNAKPEQEAQAHEALNGLGAEIIHGAEDKKLWLF